MPYEPPERIRAVLTKILADDSMNDAMAAMLSRTSEFDSPLEAKLAGIALNPKAKEKFDRELDKMWAETTIPSEAAEIVVGSGLHAAIYCGVRVAMGHPKPLVVEAKERAGGAFAVSRDATFYLNSRNRPGSLGTPGRGEALNYLPGAPVQPASLSGDDYQPNSALAFSIRSTLAMCGRVVTGQRVSKADSTGVTLEGGKRIKATRVIYATGLGDPLVPDEADGERLMDYLGFLGRMDQPFPLRGVNRVAVVGAGDAGKTVIEALVGQSPSSRWSVAALDYVERIDWYGVPNSCRNPQLWSENNRSRYKGIARVLGTVTEEGKVTKENRVRPILEKAGRTGVGFNGAYVDGALYDLVVWAVGFKAMDVGAMVDYTVGGRIVAKMAESGLFVVGPASQIVDEREANVPQTVPENTAAVFRYADRTAALAMHLPELALPKDDGGSKSKSKPKSKPRKRVKPPQRINLDGGELGPRFNAFGERIY